MLNLMIFGWQIIDFTNKCEYWLHFYNFLKLFQSQSNKKAAIYIFHTYRCTLVYRPWITLKWLIPRPSAPIEEPGR